MLQSKNGKYHVNVPRKASNSRKLQSKRKLEFTEKDGKDEAA